MTCPCGEYNDASAAPSPFAAAAENWALAASMPAFTPSAYTAGVRPIDARNVTVQNKPVNFMGLLLVLGGCGCGCGCGGSEFDAGRGANQTPRIGGCDRFSARMHTEFLQQRAHVVIDRFRRAVQSARHLRARTTLREQLQHFEFLGSETRRVGARGFIRAAGYAAHAALAHAPTHDGRQRRGTQF